jgi:hypothetical protein
MCQYGGIRILLCENSYCNHCFEKSFASVETSFVWSRKNVLGSRNVFKTSTLDQLFVCGKCWHNFSASPKEITNGKTCDFCDDEKLFCDNDECKSCYEKSFASSYDGKTMFIWDCKNGELNKILGNSTDKYKFKCKKCAHKFDISPVEILSGSKCPYCSDQKLCDNDCILCYNKSFASVFGKIDLLKWYSWSIDKNELKPRQIFKTSKEKFWFYFPLSNNYKFMSLDDATVNAPTLWFGRF